MADEIREVPTWPSGVISFDGRILEVTVGDGLRVAASDLRGIEIKKARKGRLRAKVIYASGLNNVQKTVWIPEEHEAALRELAAAAGQE